MFNFILVVLFHYSFSEPLSLQNGKKYIQYQGDHLIKCSNDRGGYYSIYNFFILSILNGYTSVNNSELFAINNKNIYFIHQNYTLETIINCNKGYHCIFSCVTLPYKKIELQPNIEFIEEISFADYTKEFYFIINKEIEVVLF